LFSETLENGKTGVKIVSGQDIPTGPIAWFWAQDEWTFWKSIMHFSCFCYALW